MSLLFLEEDTPPPAPPTPPLEPTPDWTEKIEHLSITNPADMTDLKLAKNDTMLTKLITENVVRFFFFILCLRVAY